MKKIIFFAMVLMTLLSLSSLAFAGSQHDGILLKKIVIVDALPLLSSVTVGNERASAFDDGKVVLLIPELGARASSKLSVADGSRHTRHVLLDLPKNVPSGDYWVRVVVTNEDVTRIRHRIITIE